MKQKLLSVRFWLTIGLIFSVIFAGWRIYDKVNYWGFNLSPNQKTPVWTIEAHLSFKPTGKPIQVTLARPNGLDAYKILEETISAKGYSVQEHENSYVLSREKQTKRQDIYYRLLIYDTKASSGITSKNTPPQKPEKPFFDDRKLSLAEDIIDLAKEQGGDIVRNLIRLINNAEPHESVLAFLPERKDKRETAEIIVDLLALYGQPARIMRGIHLAEDKKTMRADIMIEAYDEVTKQWWAHDMKTGEHGIPADFIVLQRNGVSLVDVVGGKDSVMQFSVLKTLNSSFKMAKYRANNTEQDWAYTNSIYNLPINQQNALKWLMIFPLAIFVVAVLRNVVGIKTMGTFTPMLIAMAFVQTGFASGLISFALITGIGLLLRAGLSRLNLLLVPRISAVVVFVILIIQMCAITGYRFNIEFASGVLFFPIIILAWIIERASIIWEEEGLKSAAKEVFNSVLVAIITYFIIVNPIIRHIMYAFNELNLVILFLIMLLGTYTGYRLTELKRFAPLIYNKKEVK